MLTRWIRTKSLRVRIAHCVINAAEECEPELANAVFIVRAIHTRELINEITSLRQLHILTQLSPVEALRAVQWLDDAKLLVVEDDQADRFESKLLLSPKMQRAIAAGQSRNAA